MNPRILVVDDEEAVRTAVSLNLRRAGMQVILAESAEQALETLSAQPVDLVLTDVKMPGATGLQLLSTIRKRRPGLPVVVMTGFSSVEDAVQAMADGAAHYLIKPVAREELLLVIRRTLDQKALENEVQTLRRQVPDAVSARRMIGNTPAMLQLLEDVRAVAATTATVLLIGPTGTGKELLAEELHYHSDRNKGPFIRVNCAAIPRDLIESELFGHERGAFTGAIRQHRGKFEQADGGTLLLDEIGEIEPHMQVKLLRVLESSQFQRVGGTDTVQVDVRVIAATNRDLAQAVADGSFREDLFYRLNVVALRLPSLAERADDIPLLVEHFVKVLSARMGRKPPVISPTDLAVLKRFPWPGNVRQLLHHVERSLILCRGEQLDLPAPKDPAELATPATGTLLPPATEARSLPEALEQLERRMILDALRNANGVQARAARQLGLSRSNLHYRIQKLGLALQGDSEE